MDTTNIPDVPRRVTIGDRIEEGGELFRRQNYELPQTRRRAREPVPSTLAHGRAQGERQK
jgi:hypothetical protein